MNLFSKLRNFIASPSHSRTMGIVVMLILVSAVSLTVIMSQQKQTVRQHASGPDCSLISDSCVSDCTSNNADGGDSAAYSSCLTNCTTTYDACVANQASTQTQPEGNNPQAATNPNNQNSPSSSTMVANTAPAISQTANPASPQSSPTNYNDCLNNCLNTYCAASRSNDPECDSRYYDSCASQCNASNPAPAQNTCHADGRTCTDSTGQSFTNACSGNSYDIYSCINNLCNKSTTLCGIGNVCADSSTGPTCQPQAVAATAKCTSDADCGTSQAYCSNDKKSLNRYACNLTNGKCEYKNLACDPGLSCYMNGLLPTCALITPTLTLTPTITETPTPTPTLPPTQLASSSASLGCPLHSKGDANCDGKIDKTDYMVWLNEMMRQSIGILTQHVADFNDDGIDNIEDAAIWNNSRLLNL